MPLRSPLTPLAVAALAVLAMLVAAPRRAASDVAAAGSADLALVLAIDCSWSVNDREYHLQVEGLAAAMRHPAVVAAIRAGPHGRIAVTVVQWAGPRMQVPAVGWTTIASASDARTLAARIALMPRTVREGATSVSGMLDFAAAVLADAPPAERRVVDVIADGINNAGGRADDARDRLLVAGVTINGLAIQNEVHYLRFWFRNHVIGGENAFVLDVDAYDDFAVAILAKLLREIRPEII